MTSLRNLLSMLESMLWERVRERVGERVREGDVEGDQDVGGVSGDSGRRERGEQRRGGASRPLSG